MLPAVLSLYITSFCQLRCSHCFLNINNLLNADVLDLADIIAILDDAEKHHVFLMPISGGDPMLHPNFFEIVKNVLQRKILPLLGITGLFIDHLAARKIKESGVPCVQVSLDGYNEKTNSIFRGRGIFQEVIRSIQVLIQAGIKTNLAVCVNLKNISYVRDILDLARDLGVYKVKVSFWQPSGTLEDQDTYRLTTQQQFDVARLCSDYQKQYDISHWITSPSSYLGKANPNNQASKLPPLVVYPSGDFTISEFGPTIGNVGRGLPSYFYKRFLEKDKLQ